MTASVQDSAADAPSRRVAALAGVPDEALLRLPNFLPFTGVGRSTWYELIKQGRAPQPVRLSARLSVWPAGSIRAWLRAQATVEAPQ